MLFFEESSIFTVAALNILSTHCVEVQAAAKCLILFICFNAD